MPSLTDRDPSAAVIHPSPPAAKAPRARGGWLRIVLLASLVAGAAAAAFLLPLERILSGFFEGVRGLGVWGPVLLALAYVPASILFVPGSILTLGAGFAFGLIVGTLTVSAGSVMGACAAFLTGRTLARGWVESRVRKDPRFAAIDEAVGRQGWKIVLLTRLSPIFPFNLLNYAYGVTRVSFRDYALASWIGMLPGTVLYVYLGTAARSLAQILSGDVQGGPGRWALLAVGLVATIAVTVLVTRTARRALREAVPPADPRGGRAGVAASRP